MHFEVAYVKVARPSEVALEKGDDTTALPPGNTKLRRCSFPGLIVSGLGLLGALVGGGVLYDAPHEDDRGSRTAERVAGVTFVTTGAVFLVVGIEMLAARPDPHAWTPPS